jgi:hypothetical protein
MADGRRLMRRQNYSQLRVALAPNGRDREHAAVGMPRDKGRGGFPAQPALAPPLAAR